ncbi:MAG: MFS transporter, partial [Pseudoclavibacter sp.]
RIGRKPLVIWGAVIAGASLLVMIPVQDMFSLLAVGFVGGLGAGLMAPANQAMAADIVGHGRSGGQVLSTFQMSQDLGTIIGPIVTGAIIDASGYGWAFALAAAIMVGSGMLWVRGPETLGRGG